MTRTARLAYEDGKVWQSSWSSLKLTDQVKNRDLPKDAYFVQQGYTVEYFLANGASQSVLNAMDKYGIKYTIRKKIQ